MRARVCSNGALHNMALLMLALVLKASQANQRCLPTVKSACVIHLIGAGAVGRKFCELLQGTQLTLGSVSDSSALLLVTADSATSLLSLKAQGMGLKAAASNLSMGSAVSTGAPGAVLDAITAVYPTARHLLVDTTASETTVPLLLEAQARGIPIAMANKVPLTVEYSTFKALTSDVTAVRYEASCGAGLPVIATLRRLLQGGDRVHRVQGALSGSLGMLMSGLQRGRKFSDLLREAVHEGYTEPDPRDDLSGLDVTRKAIIIARTLGYPLRLEDVKITPLYDKPLAKESMPAVSDFMAASHQLDSRLAKLASEAASDGNVLRFIASMVFVDGGLNASVGMEAVPTSHPLAGLQGTDNLVSIETEFYPQPLTIRGAGAGLEVTASGVLADVQELCGYR